LLEVRKKYADERRTEILKKAEELSVEDLIEDEDVVVTFSHAGYIKRLPVSAYRAQRRGGRGVTGMETREEDFVEDLFAGSTHDYILFFTNKGKVYWLKVYEIPEASRYARGKAIINLLKLGKEETVTATIPVKEFRPDLSLVMATKYGLTKKTELAAYSNPRPSGLIALRLRKDDELIGVKMTRGDQDIILATQKGKAIRFSERTVREIGRAVPSHIKSCRYSYSDVISVSNRRSKGILNRNCAYRGSRIVLCEDLVVCRRDCRRSKGLLNNYQQKPNQHY
ncbi:unnamed protein product, partial [marine sediment metagenome]